jgi:peptidoglycan/LPS O-acetylase OafA/YrhL
VLKAVFRPLLVRSIPELDTLRFVAVTLVLGHHLFFESNPVFRWLSLHGYSGVGLFFTLSGFIITRSLMKEYGRSQTIGLKNFWIRRVFRLWPSWLVTLLISGVIVYTFGLKNPEIMTELKQKWWHYFAHFGNYSYAYFGKLHTLFGHFWSLAVEEHFYLIWPLTFLLIKKYPKSTFPIFSLLIIAPYLFRVYNTSQGYENVVNTFSTHTRFDALAIGCLMAMTWHRFPKIESKLVEVILWVCSLAIFQIGLSLKFYEGSPWISQSAHTWRSVAAVLIIWLMMKAPKDGLRRLWSNSILAKLGILSYGVYLFHFITNTILFKVNVSLGLNLGHITLAILSNVLAYVPAYFALNCIDHPFEQLKEKFR